MFNKLGKIIFLIVIGFLIILFSPWLGVLLGGLLYSHFIQCMWNLDITVLSCMAGIRLIGFLISTFSFVYFIMFGYREIKEEKRERKEVKL